MSIWTDDAVADLRMLWAKGLSASTIARQLGVTRNAVIGKIHRLSGCSRPDPIPRRKKKGATGKSRVQMWQAKRVAMASLPPPKPEPVVLDATPLHRPLMVLKSRQCRWPYGDWPPYTFCACESVVGHSYCAAHLRESFRGDKTA